MSSWALLLGPIVIINNIIIFINIIIITPFAYFNAISVTPSICIHVFSIYQPDVPFKLKHIITWVLGRPMFVRLWFWLSCSISFIVFMLLFLELNIYTYNYEIVCDYVIFAKWCRGLSETLISYRWQWQSRELQR